MHQPWLTAYELEFNTDNRACCWATYGLPNVEAAISLIVSREHEKFWISRSEMSIEGLQDGSPKHSSMDTYYPYAETKRPSSVRRTGPGILARSSSFNTSNHRCGVSFCRPGTITRNEDVDGLQISRHIKLDAPPPQATWACRNLARKTHARTHPLVVDSHSDWTSSANVLSIYMVCPDSYLMTLERDVKTGMVWLVVYNADPVEPYKVFTAPIESLSGKKRPHIMQYVEYDNVGYLVIKCNSESPFEGGYANKQFIFVTININKMKQSEYHVAKALFTRDFQFQQKDENERLRFLQQLNGYSAPTVSVGGRGIFAPCSMLYSPSEGRPQC